MGFRCIFLVSVVVSAMIGEVRASPPLLPLNIAKTPEECLRLMNLTGKVNHQRVDTGTIQLPEKPPSEFTVVSWNIHKEKHPNLPIDLKTLIQQSDFILLQEAYENTAEHAEHRTVHFAPGYKTSTGLSGVMTISHTPSSLNCQLTHIEPLLRTPKATLVTRYSLNDDQELLIINLHGINFTLGKKTYAEQMQAAFSIARAHNGPLIVAGDFNSWGDWRSDYIDTFSKKMKLHDSTFIRDFRTKVFGGVLDRIIVRGVTIVHSEVIPYTTSDHYPLYIKFKIHSNNIGD